MTTDNEAWNIMGGIQDMADEELRENLQMGTADYLQYRTAGQGSFSQIESAEGGVLLKVFIPTDD